MEAEVGTKPLADATELNWAMRVGALVNAGCIYGGEN